MTGQYGTEDIAIPGFKTRHLVELQAIDWSDLLDFIQWLKSNSHISYFRTNASAPTGISVAFGVENISGTKLRAALDGQNGLSNPQIEHLLINMEPG